MHRSRVSRTLRWNRERTTFVAAMNGWRSREFGSVAGQALSHEKIALSSRLPRNEGVERLVAMARSNKLGNDPMMTEVLKLRAAMTQPGQRTKNLLHRANKERSKYSRRLTFQVTEERPVERVPIR